MHASSHTCQYALICTHAFSHVHSHAHTYQKLDKIFTVTNSHCKYLALAAHGPAGPATCRWTCADPLSLTHKALILLQPEDLADVVNAAGGELIVVLTHLVRGVREHQVPAFTSSGTKVPAVRALIMLEQQVKCHKLMLFFIEKSAVSENLSVQNKTVYWIFTFKSLTCVHVE